MFRAVLAAAMLATSACLCAAVEPLSEHQLSGDDFAPEYYPADKAQVRYGSFEDGLRIEVSDGAPPDWYRYGYQQTEVAPGQLYELVADVRTEDQRNGVGALISLAALDHQGQRMVANDSERVKRTQDWTTLRTVLFIHEGAKGLGAHLFMHGRGSAAFRTVRLRLLSEQEPLSNETITVSIGKEVTTEDYFGFGVQDDSFYFLEENTRHGVDDADTALREARIAELDPALTTSLFWWDAISPTRDLDAITYDTELMRVLYRTLAVHQAAERPIILADVHWGWSTEQFAYSEANVERGVAAYFGLLKHLIREKGFDCIKYVSIMGEPDLIFESSGGSFDSYVKACRLLRGKLDAEGLGEVRLITDKTSGTVWFSNVLAAAGECFGLLGVHEYPDVRQYPIVPERLDDAMRVIRAGYADAPRTPPAFAWEIGYFDRVAGDTDNNQSAVKQTSYGLLCAMTCNAVMNQGYAGGNMWCLHSMYYPGQNRMDFGLWDFKDRAWRIRPYYYAYGLYTRFAGAGLKPRAVVLSPGVYDISAAALEEDGEVFRVFLTSLSGNAASFTFKGLPEGAYTVYEYGKERIPGRDAVEYGKLDAIRRDVPWVWDGTPLTVPPRTLIMLERQ